MEIGSAKFDQGVNILERLVDIRESEAHQFEQKHITSPSILAKLKVIQNTGMFDNRRVIAIGDSDLSGLSIAIFGDPKEVVITDIDKRLTDLLYEANVDYDLKVRFIYHDMRLRLLEILQKQFSLVLTEPPSSKAGIEIFLSRAISCIESGSEDAIFVTLPAKNNLRDYFKDYLDKHKITILQEYSDLIDYSNSKLKADFYQIRVNPESEPSHPKHWILPFYEKEENEDVHVYRCICKKEIKVGESENMKNITQLQNQGCQCGHKGIFVYNSQVKII
ncbi:MAG: bis-aminopropyl spermidine synthase family protein [Candidatus Kariarchaeaceae archaeon]